MEKTKKRPENHSIWLKACQSSLSATHARLTRIFYVIFLVEKDGFDPGWGIIASGREVFSFLR